MDKIVHVTIIHMQELSQIQHRLGTIQLSRKRPNLGRSLEPPRRWVRRVLG
jgi:hypothetical protein